MDLFLRGVARAMAAGVPPVRGIPPPAPAAAAVPRPARSRAGGSGTLIGVGASERTIADTRGTLVPSLAP
jgi:hypothetical protein